MLDFIKLSSSKRIKIILCNRKLTKQHHISKIIHLIIIKLRQHFQFYYYKAKFAYSYIYVIGLLFKFFNRNL